MIIKDEIKYNKNLIAIITGLLLSDGHLFTKKNCTNSNYIISFTFKIYDKKKNNDVIPFNNWLKFKILREVCTLIKLNFYPYIKLIKITFSFKNLELFTQLYKLFYINENNKFKKVIPNIKFLNLYFTEESLAFMIMGDGYWDSNSKTIYICSKYFSLVYLNVLIFILRNKFNLVLTTKKRGLGYCLRFSSRGLNLKNLRDLVKPYFHEFMLYKLGL